MTYDSTQDTLKHIRTVQAFISEVTNELQKRMIYHDMSKMSDLEKNIFGEFTANLKDSTYGSDEYKKFLSEMKVALDHHYKENKHHPEHFDKGIRGMNLIDLVEMLCDWYAASLRHDDGDIYKSIEINKNRFGYSDDLAEILKNTADFLTK